MLWDEVREVLDALDRTKVSHWVGGGWGIDALVGVETRPHRDLDLAVDADDYDACMATLADLGYTVETDWLPVRVEVAASGERWVDVHPVRFDARGHGIQGDPEGRTSSTHQQRSPLDDSVAERCPACRQTSKNSSTPDTSYDPKTSTTYGSWPRCVPRQGLWERARLCQCRSGTWC